jgi:hypothetical protein
VSVGMPLVINIGFRFERISSVMRVAEGAKSTESSSTSSSKEGASRGFRVEPLGLGKQGFPTFAMHNSRREFGRDEGSWMRALSFESNSSGSAAIVQLLCSPESAPCQRRSATPARAAALRSRSSTVASGSRSRRARSKIDRVIAAAVSASL